MTCSMLIGTVAGGPRRVTACLFGPGAARPAPVPVRSGGPFGDRRGR